MAKSKDSGAEEEVAGKEKEAAKTPIRVMKKLRQLFFLCVLMGALTILLAPSWAGTPAVIVMIFYTIIGKRIARSPSSLEVFADSIYFLGFVFTFIALLVALGPLSNESAGLTSQEVIEKLGIALSTTVYGIVARIVLGHFRSTEDDLSDDVRDTISNTAGKLQGELERCVSQVVSFREGQLDSLKQSNESWSDGFSKVMEQHKTDINAFAKPFKESVNEIERLKTLLQKINEAYENSLEGLQALKLNADAVKQISSVSDNANTMFKDLSEFATKMEENVEHLGKVAEKGIQENAREVAATIAGLSKETDRTKEAADDLKKSAVFATERLQKTSVEVMEFLNDELRR